MRFFIVVVFNQIAFSYCAPALLYFLIPCWYWIMFPFYCLVFFPTSPLGLFPALKYRHDKRDREEKGEKSTKDILELNTKSNVELNGSIQTEMIEVKLLVNTCLINRQISD